MMPEHGLSSPQQRVMADRFDSNEHSRSSDIAAGWKARAPRKSLNPSRALRSVPPMADAAEQFARFKTLIATAEPPMLGPKPRAGVAIAEELARKLTTFFAAERISLATQPLLKSAALLWHDHLDASHTLSQDISTRDGSWLHGIMHRREPDYGNAKYWFHRVGKHPAFAKLIADQNLDGGALPRRRYEGAWNPFAFIDDCEVAEQGKDAALIAELRALQAAEFDALIKHIFQNA